MPFCGMSYMDDKTSLELISLHTHMCSDSLLCVWLCARKGEKTRTPVTSKYMRKLNFPLRQWMVRLSFQRHAPAALASMLEKRGLGLNLKFLKIAWLSELQRPAHCRFARKIAMKGEFVTSALLTTFISLHLVGLFWS